MKKVKKKKRKFNPKKFIKTWSIIIGVILIVVMLTNQKKDKQEEKTQETIATVEDNNNKVLTVELENPETSNQKTDWNLILINKDHKIPENYEFELQDIETKHKVDTRIVEPLKRNACRC